MREHLSTAGHVITAAAVAAGLCAGLVLGSSGDHAEAARPATAASKCGHSCFILYSRRFGQDTTMNAVIPQDNGSGGRTGSKVNLRAAADRMPDGDFAMSFVGQVWQLCGIDVHDFFASGSYLCQRDPTFAVFEAEWSPYGNSSGLCAGVAVANQSGEDITLRPCGVSDHTLWIANRTNGNGHSCKGSQDYCPWMNAGDNNFRAPQVLTLDGSTVSPADQLRLYPERLRPPGGQVRAWNNQEFAFFSHSGA
jgi:hypothetical protein